MDYHCRPNRRPFCARSGQLCKPPKWSLFMAVIAVGIAVASVQPATSQQHSILNTPPILHVPDRNWRIYETEEVGQIIARIRAEDAENDDLVYGLEPHFLSFGDADAGVTRDKLPFRIDTARGVVYLNESLAGRGGENLFLYITVTDGQLTAKNEVYVNILGSRSNKNAASRTPPPISKVVQNISQFLPAFDSLPGVQSVRNQQLNQSPSNNLPPGFGFNSGIFAPSRPNSVNSGSNADGSGYLSVLNFNPNQQKPLWSTNNPDSSSAENNNNDIGPDDKTSTTSRTKLTPINISSHNTSMSYKNRISTERPSFGDGHQANANGGSVNVHDVDVDASIPKNTSAAYSFRATMIPVIIAICGLFVAAAVIFAILYRKRLCAISKTLKKKSKEEMAKKSNQSNLSSNLTDDSRNSMVLQHWNGPTAHGNRYVPWERDQQLMQNTSTTATSQLSTSAANGGVSHPGDISPAGMMGALTNSSGVVGGVGATPGSGANGSASNSNQGKYDRWEFPRHRLKFFNILGEGAFGQVWRCEAVDIDGIEGISTVAVKTLKENAAEMEKKDLMSELEVMKSLEPHVNVVRFLGCCTEKDPIFVIIEYVNRGKLQTYLRNSRAERHYGNTHGKSNILTSSDLTSFMYQVAKGMDYLTSRGIIHRDLAARNILITDDHTCKVADFGFARDVITSKIYERKSEGKLPIRWMAIESLYDNIFSIKSDIWSFGILMWEIVTLGSTPYPGISAADVMRKVRDGYRLEKPEHCRRELYNIMYYCWSNDANERPTFSEIVQMLDKLLHTEMDYIELERFPDHNYYNILNLSGEKL